VHLFNLPKTRQNRVKRLTICRVPDVNNKTSKTVDFLTSLKSCLGFKREMLPPTIAPENLISALQFISPQLILIHGSCITKIRYSPEGSKDIDLVVVSIKAAFWPIGDLCKEIRRRLSRISRSIKFDISLTTPSRLIAHINGRTSLGQSLLQGFIILYGVAMEKNVNAGQ